jgi:hypothetical protein
VRVARKLGIRLWIMLRDEIDYEEFCRRGQKHQSGAACALRLRLRHCYLSRRRSAYRPQRKGPPLHQKGVGKRMREEFLC